MNGALLLLIGMAFFSLAYFVYSAFIAKSLGIEASRPTPAHTLRDGIDYVPAHPTVLYGHHFAAIAGAGPIIGPVLASEFGWGSVALWIILGCIFVGSMHDMVTLFLSVRHEGKSVGTIIEEVLGKTGKVIFLLFSFSALVLVMSVFTGQVADAFVSNPEVATSSLLGIFEAALFGLCVYKLRWSVFTASFIFVPLLFLLVWVGVVLPCDLQTIFGITEGAAKATWVVILLVYCFVASTLPVWLLLQPRDYLNSYLLYAMLAIGLTAVFFVCPSVNINAFSGITVKSYTGAMNNVFPFLFVTVACGACSGFHALVASGTTAKQVDKESHIRPIGYGCMLLEGVVALLALVAVAWNSQEGLIEGLSKGKPVVLFAQGLARFCAGMGLPEKTSESFMLLAVAAFLMTSVDACTRLARFVWQELWSTGSSSNLAKSEPSPIVRLNRNMYFATAVVVSLGVYLLVFNPSVVKNLWTMFASSNQMLASLTLLTATLWLIKNRCNFWFVAIPMVFMLATSMTAMAQLFLDNFRSATEGGFANGGVVAVAAAFLAVLQVFLLCLGVRRVIEMRRKSV